MSVRTNARRKIITKTALLILIVVFFSLISLKLSAFSDQEEVFQRGVEAYEARNYDLALESFLFLVEEGIVNAELFHNIGNTYYRQNELGLAILNYKKGLKLQPNNRLLKNNLNYLLALTKDRQTTEETNPFLLILHRIVFALSLNSLFLLTLFIILLIVLVINTLIIYYKNNERTVPLFILSLLIVLFLLSGTVSLYRWRDYKDDSEGVLISSSTTGYSGPAEDYTNLFTIHEGMIIIVNIEGEDWSQITLPSGVTGWIRNDSFRRVKLE
jgi:tetratricopeptide (TPR) repeat protein